MADGEQPTETTGTAPALRASDAERERAATLLRDHAAAGRLTPEELDERLDVAYAARTVGELDALTHDLPQTRVPTAPRARALDRPGVRERALHAIGFVVLVNLACNVIWLATGADGAWWPKWVLLATVLRLAFQLWAVLGPGGDHARDEARLGRGGVRPRELPREPGDDR
ncbi:MAG TPA: DUF1707 domain-containing protein [Conexibacter sp.]|nr:DUF1707 domain-containing protein [Conexibacter sp.]